MWEENLRRREEAIRTKEKDISLIGKICILESSDIRGCAGCIVKIIEDDDITFKVSVILPTCKKVPVVFIGGGDCINLSKNSNTFEPYTLTDWDKARILAFKLCNFNIDFVSEIC